MPPGGEDRHLFLGRRVPPSFEWRSVTIDPGGRRAYDCAEWLDSIVAVEQGSVELEAVDGERHRFAPGALIWLDGIDLRAIHNRSVVPAVLVAIRRGRRGEAVGHGT
ncbi:MAG: hypothetical protein ABW122_12815 [Ilumatobacteraceae bacterium]